MYKSLLSLTVILIVLANFSSVANAESKIVKVGWYDSPFNYTDVLATPMSISRKLQFTMIGNMNMSTAVGLNFLKSWRTVKLI